MNAGGEHEPRAAEDPEDPRPMYTGEIPIYG